MCISETFLNDNIPDEPFAVNGYNLMRRDRQHRRGGGVMCYVKDDITLYQWDELKEEEVETSS